MRGAFEGALAGLRIDAVPGADPADYALLLDDVAVPLNAHIGGGIRMAYLGTVICRYCGASGRRSYGGGYCYDCFTTLARCDLCVVSPDRCHYAAGTCREPAWGEAFCMQPHRVYLANSSGIKVGITRRGRERGRWLDQGAIQGLVLLEADSRRSAGLAEVSIARLLPDRTDWRKMLRADVPAQDLPAARARLQAADLELPEGVRWAEGQRVAQFTYPLTRAEAPGARLKVVDGDLRGNLLGMKGQYLLLSSGVFNVREHAGFRVRLELVEPLAEAPGKGEQLGLF